MKKMVSVLILTMAFIFAGCSSNKRVTHIERQAFITSIETINSTSIYDSNSLSTFSLREAMPDDWYVGDSDIDDGVYCLQGNTVSRDVPLSSLTYYEIDSTGNELENRVAILLEIYTPSALLYETYTSNDIFEGWRLNSYGDINDDYYLVYIDGYSYLYEHDFYYMIYRNDNKLMFFCADSENDFNSFVNEIGFPEVNDFNSVFDFGEGNIFLNDDEQVFSYLIFEDNNEATQYFEDRYYDNFVDICEDNDFDGYFSYDRFGERGDYSGYILLNGEFDDVQYVQYDYSYDYLQKVYGGFYLKDNIVITAYTRTNSQRRMDIIDQVLRELSLPTLPNK